MNYRFLQSLHFQMIPEWDWPAEADVPVHPENTYKHTNSYSYPAKSNMLFLVPFIFRCLIPGLLTGHLQLAYC